MIKVTGVLAVLATACTTQPPDPDEIAAREYRREDDRIKAIELYEQRRRGCAAQGGVMQVPRMSNGRLPPTDRELRLASCVSDFYRGQWL